MLIYLNKYDMRVGTPFFMGNQKESHMLLLLLLFFCAEGGGVPVKIQTAG